MTSYEYVPAGYQPTAPFIDVSDLPKPLTLRLDEPASISVRVSGWPPPTVKWQIGRKRVKESVKYHMESDGNETHSLVVSRVTRDLEQGVWVVATNGYGEDCSLVEIRTLEIVFKQRIFKKEQNSMKRVNSLGSERTSVSRANSSTNSFSIHNNSIMSLKDWKDEMAIRNMMRSVDDLVFAADKASLVSGLGYSLSVNMADSDDPDFIEQFHTLSKRSRRQPPPVRATGLVFRELEPRCSGPESSFRNPGRIKESDLEELGPSRTPQSKRLSKSVDSRGDKTPKNQENVQNSVNENDENTEKKIKQKKKKNKIKQSAPAIGTRRDRHTKNETVAEGDDDDAGGGDDDDRDQDLRRGNFASEDDSVWALFGENLSNFCHDVFDKFPKVESKNGEITAFNSPLKLTSQPQVKDSRSAEILNNVDQRSSKSVGLRNSPGSDRTKNVRIDKNNSTKHRGKIKKPVDGDRLTVEETDGMMVQKKSYPPIENCVENVSETPEVLQNVAEKRKKRPKRRSSLSLSADVINPEVKPEVIIEPDYSMSVSPTRVKSGAKKEKKQKHCGLKSKSEANVGANDDVTLGGSDVRGEAENDLDLCRRLQVDDNEAKVDEEENATKNPVTKKKKIKNKEIVSDIKSSKTKKKENLLTKPSSETDSEKRFASIDDNISNVPNKKSIIADSESQINKEIPQVETLPAVQSDTEKTLDNIKSSSKTKRKKSAKTRNMEQVPLNSSYAVVSGDGFIAETDNEASGGRLSSESNAKKPVDKIPESKEILYDNSKINAENSKKFPASETSENPTPENPDNSKKERKRRKTKLIKSNFSNDKTELLVVDGKTQETKFEIRNSLSVENENADPVNDIVDYCNEPVRRRPMSSRVRSAEVLKVIEDNDLDQMEENRHVHDTPIHSIPQSSRGNKSTKNNFPTSDSNITETVEQNSKQNELNQFLVEWKDSGEIVNKEKPKKTRHRKNRRSTISVVTSDTSSTTRQSENSTGTATVPVEVTSSELNQLPNKDFNNTTEQNSQQNESNQFPVEWKDSGENISKEKQKKIQNRKNRRSTTSVVTSDISSTARQFENSTDTAAVPTEFASPDLTQLPIKDYNKSTEPNSQQNESHQFPVEWKDSGENFSKDKQKKSQNRKSRRSTVSEVTLDTSSTTRQSENSTGTVTVPVEVTSSELNQLRDNSTVLHAHETLILKALAEKLHSGQIEIIVVNKDSKSNDNESNAAQSGADTLSTLLNLCSAGDTDKTPAEKVGGEIEFVDADESFKESKETIHQLKSVGETQQTSTINIDSHLSSNEMLTSEHKEQSASQVLKTDTPVPKPRTLLSNRNSMIKSKTENSADKANQVQEISDETSQSKGLDAPESRSAVETRSGSTKKNPKTKLRKPAASNTNNEALRDKLSESRQKFFENPLSQHNEDPVKSSEKENSKSPTPLKSQEPHFEELVHSSSQSSQKSVVSETIDESNRNSDPSKDEAVKSRSTGCQTDATLMTSLPSDVIVNQASSTGAKVKSDSEVQTVPESNTLGTVDRQIENPKRQLSSERTSVSTESSHVIKNVRQKPVKTYIPVFPNYFHGYGSVYHRRLGPDYVVNTGMMRIPGDYLPGHLPYMVNQTHGRQPRQVVRTGDSSVNGTEETGGSYSDLAEKNSTVVKKSVKSETSLNGKFTKSGETPDSGLKLQDNPLSNSSVKIVGQEESGSSPRNVNLIENSMEKASTNSSSVSFIDDDGHRDGHGHGRDGHGHGRDGHPVVQCNGLDPARKVASGAGRDPPTRVEPETGTEDFITSAVTLEYGEMIKLFPAN